MSDVHIFTLLNIQRKLYVGDCLIYYGYPSNSLWSSGDNCTQISPYILIMFYHRINLFKTYFLISPVWIITKIVYLLSSFDIDVGIYVFKSVVGYFKSMTKMMTSSGFWNYCRMYYFSFSLKFLY